MNIDKIASEINTITGGDSLNYAAIKIILDNNLDPKFTEDEDGLRLKISDINDKISTLNNDRISYSKKLEEMRDLVTIEVEYNLPEKLSDYSDEQLTWLLYHWHDETSLGFELRNKILTKNGFYISGINGFDNCKDVKQFKFLISSDSFHKVVDFYKIAKHTLIGFQSKLDDTPNIIAYCTHTNVYCWDSSYDGVHVEIDKETDKARFVAYYRSTYSDNHTEWMELDEIQSTLLKYKYYDIDNDG